ncbi:hypothetical protein [Nocardiopsis salina]|uniref:hypothetical protein n=1 Tax=Nocardiopsis salina TaxID=245836 RepID=UPI0003474BA1|nr:hypothetical protein [Nocardiopsis salina]
MSTPPQTPEKTEPSENPKSADGPKFWFVALYPLVGGTALMVISFFALFGLLYNDTSYAALFVLVAPALIGGVHFWIQYVLEGRDEPHPWQFPTILSTAMVASIFVMLFPIFMHVELILPLPLVGLVISLIGIFVFSIGAELGTDRKGFVLALGAILGVVLLVVGVTFWLDFFR